MSAMELIAKCEQSGLTLIPALDYEGPDGELDADLERNLKERKVELIRALVGPADTDPRSDPVSPDWRFEWLREVGLIYLRGRESPDAHVKALLRELLAETPKTLVQWFVLGRLIRDTEADLRRAGKLPPIPNFGP